MENATKALLIAGGVLIAIIILTILVKTYGNIGAFQRQQMSQEEAEQIEEFNKDYTKYDGQYVYGTEVITIINKILDYKEKQGIEIEVKISFLDPYEYQIKNKKYTTKSINLKNESDVYTFIDFTRNNTNFNNENDSSDIKNRAFKCTKVDQDSTTGKVNYIEFQEKKYNQSSSNQ